MADNVLRELLLLVGIEGDSEAIKALDAVDSAFDETGARAGDLIALLGEAAAAFAAVGAAAVAQAVSTGQYAEQIQMQADAVGISTDRYQEYEYAANKANLSSEELATVLQKLGTSAAKAEDGGKALTEAYKELGLNAKKMDALSPDERIAAIADALQKMKDPADRLTAATRIFGSALARKVVPFLDQGSAGLKAMAKAAHDAGYVLSGPALDSANAFNDQVENMGLLLTSLRNEVGMDVIPTLTELATEFRGWYDANREVIKQKIDEYAGKIADAFREVAGAVEVANDKVGGVEGWEKLGTIVAELAAAGGIALVAYRVVRLGLAIANTAKAAWALAAPLTDVLAIGADYGIAGLVTAVGALASAFGEVVIPVAAVVAGVTALGFALQDVYTYIEGGDSITGRLLGPDWRNTFDAFVDDLHSIEALLGALYNLATAAGAAVARELTPAFTEAESTLQPLIDGLRELVALLESIPGPASLINAGLRGVGAVAEFNAGANTSTVGAINAYAASLGSSYAPTPASVGAGPAAGPRSITIGGDTLVIQGANSISRQEAADLMAQHTAEKNRATMATINAGGGM